MGLLVTSCESIETSQTPIVTVGDLSGTGPSFGAVADGALFADGAFVVIDDQDKRLSIFDSTGTRLAQAGREGEGPGEFLEPASVRTSGDTIIVWDRRLNRWSYFDRTGALLATESYPSSSRASVTGPFADGSVITMRGTPFKMSEAARDTLIIEWRASPLSDSATTIGRFPWSTKYADLSSGFSVFTAPFRPRTTVSVWTDRNVIAVGTAEEAAILLIPLDRGDTWKIPVPLQGPEVTDEMISTWMEENPAAAQVLGGMSFPERAPPYASIHADQAGFVWVEATPGAGSDGTRYLVLREDGTQAEDLHFRGDADLLRANERYALLRMTDELGVQRVQLYGRECSYSA